MVGDTHWFLISPQSEENYNNVYYTEPLHRMTSEVGGPTLLT